MNFQFILLVYYLITLGSRPSVRSQQIATGHLPVVVADTSGILHLVYGNDSTIYYATARGEAVDFNEPVPIAILPGLVAGAKRGPQIAVTDSFVVVTAVNRAGDVFAYSLNRVTNQWSSAIRINDIPQIAKEGFQAVTGTSSGIFHAVWLDLRDDKQNKIVGATSHDGGLTWSVNLTIYRSPSGTVCECCRVSVTAQNNDVYVQFRNSLSGSRDLYLAHSADGGKTYPQVQKLGIGTWKLNACPMDGGGIALSRTGQLITAWRRADTLYLCQPDKPEQAIINGRNVTIALGSTGPVIAWDNANIIWLKETDKSPVSLGEGQMPSITIITHKAVCVWESKGQVMMATISL